MKSLGIICTAFLLMSSCAANRQSSDVSPFSTDSSRGISINTRKETAALVQESLSVLSKESYQVNPIVGCVEYILAVKAMEEKPLKVLPVINQILYGKQEYTELPHPVHAFCKAYYDEWIEKVEGFKLQMQEASNSSSSESEKSKYKKSIDLLNKKLDALSRLSRYHQADGYAQNDFTRSEDLEIEPQDTAA